MAKICPIRQIRLESYLGRGFDDPDKKVYIKYGACLEDECALWIRKELTPSDTYHAKEVNSEGRCGLIFHINKSFE